MMKHEHGLKSRVLQWPEVAGHLRIATVATTHNAMDPAVRIFQNGGEVFKIVRSKSHTKLIKNVLLLSIVRSFKLAFL